MKLIQGYTTTTASDSEAESDVEQQVDSEYSDSDSDSDDSTSSSSGVDSADVSSTSSTDDDDQYTGEEDDFDGYDTVDWDGMLYEYIQNIQIIAINMSNTNIVGQYNFVLLSNRTRSSIRKR